MAASTATAVPAPGGVRKSLSHLTLFLYAAPATPLALVGLPLAVYLPAVYADSDGFGLSLALVGLLLTLSRVTDVITDPIIGFASDRLRTRWGRRKPFILLGAPLYGAAIWMLFVPPVEPGYGYLFLFLVLVYLGSTLIDLPYAAWGAELSRSYNERTLITSWREGTQVAGALLSAFTPAIILFVGFTKPTDAVFFLSIMMCVALPVTVLGAVGGVPEWPVLETGRRRIPLLEGLRTVRRNGPYMRLIIIFAFSSLGSAMTNSLSFFFVKHVILAGGLYGLYLAPYFLAQIVAIPLWFKLSRRIGKHRATMVAIGWYAFWASFIPAIALAPQYWFDVFEIPRVLEPLLPAAWHQGITGYFEGIDTGKFLFFVLIMCLKGSAIGALAALPASMAADVVDVDTGRTGEQRAGAYFSIWSMVRKAAYALGIAIGTGLAAAFGFDSLADPFSGANSEFSLFMLACLYSVVPALFKFVAMPLLWSYPLTEERLARIQERIRRRNQARSRSPDRDVAAQAGAAAD